MREQGLQSCCWVLLLSGALVVAMTAAMQMNNLEERSLVSKFRRSTDPVETEGKQEIFAKKPSKLQLKLAEKAARVTEGPVAVTPEPINEEQNVTTAGSSEGAEEGRQGRFVEKFKAWYEGKKQPPAEEKREETEIIINSHLSGGHSHPHLPYYPVVQPIIIGGGSTVVTKPVTHMVTHTLVVQEPQSKPTVVLVQASHHHHETPTVVVTHTHTSTQEEQPTFVIVEAPHTHQTQTVTITHSKPSHSKPPHIVIQTTMPSYSTPSHVFIQEPHTHTIMHPHHHHPEWNFGVDFIGQAEGSVQSHGHVVHVVKPLESSHGSKPTMSEVIVVDHDSESGFKKLSDSFYDFGKNIKKKFDEQVTGISSMFSTQEHGDDHSHVIILQKPEPKPQPVVQTVTLAKHPHHHHHHPEAKGHVTAVFAGQGHFNVGRGHGVTSTSTITIQTVQSSSCVYCG